MSPRMDQSELTIISGVPPVVRIGAGGAFDQRITPKPVDSAPERNY
jgi:hypothetical protein